MTDSNTEESSPVAKDDNINAIPETSSADLEIQDIQGIGPTTAKNTAKFGFLRHHSAQFKRGIWDGYGDSISASTNDNGSYGARGCKW
ncbi:MAG: hypothetical protein WCC17_00030 [Candidatus Nitrosopolaris sp.]|jgi:hypothetical protein